MTKVVYEADLDLAKLKSKAAEIERILTEAFKQAGQAGSKDSGIAKALQDQARAAVEAERQATATIKAEATEREQIARAESQERIQAARAGAQGTVEAERQATQTVRAAAEERIQAAKAESQQEI